MVKSFFRVYACLLLKIDIFLQRAVSAFTNCTFIQYFSTGLVSILDFILDCNKFPGLTVVALRLARAARPRDSQPKLQKIN